MVKMVRMMILKKKPVKRNWSKMNEDKNEENEDTKVKIEKKEERIEISGDEFRKRVYINPFTNETFEYSSVDITNIV